MRRVLVLPLFTCLVAPTSALAGDGRVDRHPKVIMADRVAFHPEDFFAVV